MNINNKLDKIPKIDKKKCMRTKQHHTRTHLEEHKKPKLNFLITKHSFEISLK